MIIARTRQRRAHRADAWPGTGWRLVTGILRGVGRLVQGLAATGLSAALLGGLPWALWHFIGWPLPDHVPTWDEIQAVLLSPMTDRLLLDVLACLCWVAWVAFVIDVLRCAMQAVRGARWPELATGGPVHTVAAVLIGAIVVSVLGNRSAAQPSSRPNSEPLGFEDVVATAPVWPPHTASVPTDIQTASLITTSSLDSAGPKTKTATVRAPQNGVHDSLWRIADRELGDGARWPEIFALNKGKTQPNGGTLTNPNLIFPGEELLVPTVDPPGADTQPEPPPLPPPPSTQTAPPAASTTPPTSPTSPTNEPTSPAPATPPAPTADHGTPGLAWGPEIFVGLGLAAAVSAALLAARRRHRRGYQPGSGRRDDLPVAPVVHRLRLAHLRATAEPDEDVRSAITPAPALIIGPTYLPGGPEHTGPARAAPELGVRDGREIALDLAVARGLGLVGPGAAAAARAVLLALLTRAAEMSVVVAATDLATLLGTRPAVADPPARLHVVSDLDAALDNLEAEILRRTRDDHQPNGGWPVLALVARPPERSSRRLQAILDNGATVGIVGVLLGQWQPGVTAHIRADGTVSATNPGVGEALEGTRMYQLPGADANDLLHLLRQAQPDNPGDAPTGNSDTASTPPSGRHPKHPATPHPAAVDTPASGPDDIGDEPAEDIRPQATDTDLEITRPPIQPDPAGAAEQESPHIEIAPPPSSETRPGPVDDDYLGRPVTVTVLGAPAVRWRPDTNDTGVERDITAAFPPRQRELLVFLALHPDGVHRDTVATTLWADNPPDRPTNALNTALSRLRRAVSTATDGALSDLTLLREGRYRLDPQLVDVDYWRFRDAMAAHRSVRTDQERTTALRRVVDTYRGRLADGMDTEWIDATREATARDAIDAVAALARALIDADPERTLNLLETARGSDPHNEMLYRDIMRLQGRLGRLDAIPRTLTLLTTRLAEIDEQPSPETVRLAAHLQHRHDPSPTTPHTHRQPAHADDRRGNAAAS